jgi:lactate 2-monooxygenase
MSGVAYGRQRQREIYLAGLRGRRPRVPQNAEALERAAARAMTREGFAYVAGGAGLETTMRANREAFDRVRIVPRMLRGAQSRDLRVELFGRTLPAPLLLAPIGVLEMAHPDADLAVARAAAAEGVPMIFSSQASRPLEHCAAAMGAAPRWFQLYMSTSDDVVRRFVARAERSGCEAIVITLDTTLLGWRLRDLDLAYLPFALGKGIAQYVADPEFQKQVDVAPEPDRGDVNLAALRSLLQVSKAYPGSLWRNVRSSRPRKAVATFLETFTRPSLSWDDIALVREATQLPLLLKGILHPDDARKALDYGIDGIVVSNHGGRQVDGAVASLDALPAIVEVVGDRVPVLLDSGIRGGADVFKALALGARAVFVGRPYCYGLAIAGEEGVREVIRNFLADLDLTLALTGHARLADVSVSSLTSTAGL